jgi:hypothetical protein
MADGTAYQNRHLDYFKSRLHVKASHIEMVDGQPQRMEIAGVHLPTLELALLAAERMRACWTVSLNGASVQIEDPVTRKILNMWEYLPTIDRKAWEWKRTK